MERSVTRESRIRWFDAKMVHPAKDCKVVAVIKCDDVKKITSIMSIYYVDGHFNGDHEFDDDVIWWTYFDEMADLPIRREEDDF